MEDLTAAFKKLDALEEKFKEVSRDIYHTTPLVSYHLQQTVTKGKGEDVISGGSINFDLRDVMLLGPITQTNTILPGKSGIAKTHLAEIMLAVCYGSHNYGFLPINAGLSEEKLRDFVFSVIKKGGELSEATKMTLILSAPGVQLDELNRAPKELMGLLQNYLQNGKLVFEGGRQIIPGVKLPNGQVYQFKLGTCNEGREYAVFLMEKAYRDRFGFEIPITSFPMADDDNRKLEEKLSTGMHFGECKENRLDDLLAIDKTLREIPTDILAKETIRYLGRMSNCVKSLTKSKDDIEMNNELCNGCHAVALHNRICPEVKAPTKRTIISLQHMAKAFAFMRGYRAIKSVEEGKISAEFMESYLGSRPKNLPEAFLNAYLQNLTATKEDVRKTAPFSLLNKIDMTPEWVKKHFQGNQMLAIGFLMQIIEERVVNYYRANSDILHSYTSGSEGAESLTEEQKERLKKYAKKDPWCIDLRLLESGKGTMPAEGPKFSFLS